MVFGPLLSNGSVSVHFKNARVEKMPLNICIQWSAGTACVSECVLKTLACRGLRVDPSSKAPTRNVPERVRDTIMTFPKRSGEPPVWNPPRGLATLKSGICKRGRHKGVSLIVLKTNRKKTEQIGTNRGIPETGAQIGTNRKKTGKSEQIGSNRGDPVQPTPNCGLLSKIWPVKVAAALSGEDLSSHEARLKVARRCLDDAATHLKTEKDQRERRRHPR